MKAMTVQFRKDRPGEADLRMDAAWCPYQYPDELEDLRTWGVEDSVIRRELLDRVDAEHCHPYYSVPETAEIPPRNLLLVAADIRFGKVGQEGFGYVVISDGEPSSLTVFHEGEEIIFYNDPAEVGENRGALGRLELTTDGELVVAMVDLRQRVPGFPSICFEIP